MASKTTSGETLKRKVIAILYFSMVTLASLYLGFLTYLKEFLHNVYFAQLSIVLLSVAFSTCLFEHRFERGRYFRNFIIAGLFYFCAAFLVYPLHFTLSFFKDPTTANIFDLESLIKISFFWVKATFFAVGHTLIIGWFFGNLWAKMWAPDVVEILSIDE